MSPVDSVVLRDQDSDEYPPRHVLRIHGHPGTEHDAMAAVSIEFCEYDESTDTAQFAVLATIYIAIEDLIGSLALVMGDHSLTVPPGQCFHDPGITWEDGYTPRCELLAGHAGAHECDRRELGGSAVWTDAEGRRDPVIESTTTEEWSVRMGDGDVLDSWTNREAAAGFIISARKEIADGEWEADDYEPMELVHRTRTTYADQLTEWTVATEAGSSDE